MTKIVPKFAAGGITEGIYSGAFGKEYDANNPYTLGMTGEKTYTFPTATASSNGTISSLLPTTIPVQSAKDIWYSLDPQIQKYYTKKGAVLQGDAGAEQIGKWSATDLMNQFNSVLKAKGSNPISSWDQLADATSPLIAKRNKRGLGGIGGMLGSILPIAGMMIPGIGWLGSAALGAVGGAMSGGARGALLGGITGGLGSALKGTTMLGGMAQGVPQVADKVLKVPGASSFSISSLLSDPTKVLSGVGSVAGMLGSGSSKEDDGNSLTPEQQQMLYQQMLASQSRPNSSIFMANMGRGYAQGGTISSFLGQGNMYATGRMVNGAGDGMSDDVPATIDNNEPAALSDGEHVVPSLQVAMLGRGSSKAGSKRVSDIVLKEIEKMYGKGTNPLKMQKKAMSKDK